MGTGHVLKPKMAKRNNCKKQLENKTKQKENTKTKQNHWNDSKYVKIRKKWLSMMQRQ